MEFPSLEGLKSLVDVALGDRVALAVLGEQLDSMVSEDFSTINDSMILCFLSPWQKFLLILGALLHFEYHLWQYFHIHSVLPPTLYLSLPWCPQLHSCLPQPFHIHIWGGSTGSWRSCVPHPQPDTFFCNAVLFWLCSNQFLCSAFFL